MAHAMTLQHRVKDGAIQVGTLVSERATSATHRLVDAANKAAAPHVKTLRTQYKVHVQPQVDQHVLPVYKQHVLPFYQKAVVPLIDKAVELKDEVTPRIAALANHAHGKMVASYKASCPNTRKQLQNMNAPPAYIQRVSEWCQTPEQTVTVFLKIMLGLLILIFRKFLWRTLIGLVLLPFRILWFVSPLRLIFGKKKANEDDGNVTPPQPE